MKHSDCLFWNVDTQFDFVSPQGKLYVPGAELLKPNWKRITDFAKNSRISVVNTADWHYDNSAELAENPDFVNTFPQHCMANTSGAEFIEETNPENPLIINWESKDWIGNDFIDPGKHQNYIIRKDAFDVFSGNRYTDKLLRLLSPKTVIVYGVTTNVCVNDAVMGLAKRVERVFVIENAIKELPNIPLPFEKWAKIGVKLIKLDELEEVIQN